MNDTATLLSVWLPLSARPADYLLDRTAELRSMALTATTVDVADALIRLAERFERLAAERSAPQ
jgi:hypothetical protein